MLQRLEVHDQSAGLQTAAALQHKQHNQARLTCASPAPTAAPTMAPTGTPAVLLDVVSPPAPEPEVLPPAPGAGAGAGLAEGAPASTPITEL